MTTASRQFPSLTQEKRSIQYQGWAVLLTIWLCFGLESLINSFILREIIDAVNVIRLPENTRESAWMIMAIWISAYLVGFGIGLFYRDERRAAINSTILGYLIATTLHILFLGIFPGTPIDGFGVLRDIASLEPLPVYYTFILLTLGLGPIVIGLATFTGTLVASEVLDLPRSLTPQIDMGTVLFSTLFPLAIMMTVIGIFNYADIDKVQSTTNSFQKTIEAYNDTAMRLEDRETVPPLLLLHLDQVSRFMNNILLALFIGVIVGLKRNIASSQEAGQSALLGMGIYLLVILSLLDIIDPDTTANIDYTSIYEDALGSMRAPELVDFALLWFIPPALAGTTASAMHRALNNTIRQPQATLNPE